MGFRSEDALNARKQHEKNDLKSILSRTWLIHSSYPSILHYFSFSHPFNKRLFPYNSSVGTARPRVV